MDQLLKKLPKANIDFCVSSPATVNFRIVLQEGEKYFGYDLAFDRKPLVFFQVGMDAIL